MEPWPKSFKLVWRCHQLLSGFLAKGYLPRVPYQPLLSANDKDDKVMPGTVNWSPGIYLMGLDISGKSQKGDSLMKIVRPFIALNGIPYLQLM